MSEKKHDIVENSDATIVVLPKHSVLLDMADGPAKDPETPVKKQSGSKVYEPLGDSNNFWQETYDRSRKTSHIHPALAWQSNQLASCRLQYGIIEGYDKNRNEIFTPADIPAVEDFLAMNNMELYMEEGIKDLKFWSHAFPEIRLNSNGTYASTLSVYDALHCRFGRQNKKTGNKDFVYVDANWPNGTDDTWKQIPCLDPYFDVEGQMRSSKKRAFIYPLFFSSPGKIYYQDTPWHTIINSYWLDVAEKIPQFKVFLMKNQMTVKYIIHVPESWWRWKYKDWDTKESKKEERRRSVYTDFNNILTGVEKTGKALMMTFRDQALGKQFTKWEIIEMKGTLGDGAYIEDSQEATSHVLFSMGQQPALMGQTPGKGLGAGSGSDIRVGHNVFMINNRIFLNKMASPLQVITRFNKWKGLNNKPLVWRPVNYQIEVTSTGNQATQTN